VTLASDDDVRPVVRAANKNTVYPDAVQQALLDQEAP